MKKFFSLFTIAMLGVAAVANAAEGSVTFQLDMNLGKGEPDLLPQETEVVEASYENGLLKVTQMPFGLNPVEFTVDLETGDVVASYQEATEEEGQTFFYYDVKSGEMELYGNLTNLGADKCQLVLQPWGVGDYYPGYGVFFMVTLYNTVFTFDFSIPGLDVDMNVPMLEIADVDHETVTSEYGAYAGFTVAVASENLPEEADIEVYYKGPYDNDFKRAEENVDGTYSFSLAGLEPELEYTVEIYAKAGQVVSETEFYTFRFELAGIDSLSGEKTHSKYYNLKGVEVKNPKSGDLYIELNNGNAKKILIQ